MLEKPLEVRPQRLRIDDACARERPVGEPAVIQAAHGRPTASAVSETRPQPAEDRHPVVRPHSNAERSHVAYECADRFEFLIPPGQPESETVHGGVVLDDFEGQPRLGDLVAVARKRRVVPGLFARLLTPVGVDAG